MMTLKFVSREMLTKQRAYAEFKAGLKLSDHLREVEKLANGHRVYEFVGTDTFGVEWNRRQFYEVDAGRQEEPILYLPIYTELRNAGFPKNVSVNRMGPAAVIFDELFEGGEVKFSTIGSSDFSVPIRHWGTGLEYSKDLVIFNELWDVPLVERGVGIAHNALLNHIHFTPILTYTYAAANQTAGNTGGASTVEDYMLTIEDAISNSKADATNPRRGPYVLLISGNRMFTVEKALTLVPQQGVSLQSRTALESIRGVVAYDGWTGTRGDKTVTYTGVPSTKAYLISLQYGAKDFRSYVKQDLMGTGPQQDITRFLTQTAWDSYFGVYANPIASVEEITWPT